MFLFYDHLVTLGGFSEILIANTDDPTKKGVEVELVWGRPLRSGRWFFLNRYFAFFGNLAVLVINFFHSSPAVRFTVFSLVL